MKFSQLTQSELDRQLFDLALNGNANGVRELLYWGANPEANPYEAEGPLKGKHWRLYHFIASTRRKMSFWDMARAGFSTAHYEYFLKVAAEVKPAVEQRRRFQCLHNGQQVGKVRLM